MIDRFRHTRRDILQTAILGTISVPLAPFLKGQGTKEFSEPAAAPYSGSDDALLDEIERTTFEFFWNEAGASGQVRDRALLNGHDKRREASIAATGFGLTALCIADAREYGKRHDILERVRATLRFTWNKLPHEHGFFYHFIDLDSGKRAWKCELSSIDTALLLCGVLTARQH